MSLTFAINGFGRIGRNVLRAYIERRNNTLQLLAINDLAAIEHAAFLLEYDSVHGHLKADIRYEGIIFISMPCHLSAIFKKLPPPS